MQGHGDYLTRLFIGSFNVLYMKTFIAYLLLASIHLQVACMPDAAKSHEGTGDLPTAALSPTDSVFICLGKSSYSYHIKYCQGLKQCRAEVMRVAFEKAQALKRKPCGYCFGDQSPAYSEKSVEQASASQCLAITKKGTRCSRKARSNNRCWQHGG